VAVDSNHSIRPYEGNDPYVFICYSHADAEVHGEIHWLQNQGINVWYDQGITPGSVWTEALARKIEGCDFFIYFLSESSANSEHCQRELSFAQGKKKHVLAVQLAGFELPSGLQLSLQNRQIIHRFGLSEKEYHTRLASALGRDTEALQPVYDGDTGSKPNARTKWVALALVVVTVSVGAFFLYQHRQTTETGFSEKQPIGAGPE